MGALRTIKSTKSLVLGYMVASYVHVCLIVYAEYSYAIITKCLLIGSI